MVTIVYSVLVVQLCPTLCDPMDCGLPGSSVHGILQARILEWVAIPFSGGSSQPRDGARVSCLAGRFFTIWAKGKTHRWWLQPQNLKMLDPWKKSYDQPRQHIKKWRHYFANKGLSSQSYVFSSSHVWMWELGYKESWASKNWRFWTMVLEKSLESLLDCKEIQPVHPKGNQSWIFIGRTDTEAETLILWLPDVKNWLIGKDPDAGKDWRREEKGTTEDAMIGWHHWLDGHESE